MKNTVVITLLLVLPFFIKGQDIPRYGIVISEIMANPSAAHSLPNVKYIELFNRSGQYIDLQGWSITDGSSTGRINKNYLLPPDSFVVISSTTGANTIATVTAAIGVTNFPTLRVNGDELILRSPEGQTIHAVAYNREWYGNELKSVSGWSLEMIDLHNPCGPHNWMASTAIAGGTPGAVNSVQAPNSDIQNPRALHAIASDSLHVLIHFSESLDSSIAANPGLYSINGNTIMEAEPIAPLFNSIKITTDQPLQRHQLHTLVLGAAIKDCAGNALNAPLRLPTGLPETIQKRDVIINEILFNPPPGGTDYIELYNRSSKILNLRDLHITHRNASGTLVSPKPISTENKLLFPGGYIVVTESAAMLGQHYSVKDPDVVMELSSMPSMPNDGGNLVLLNATGESIDELSYSEKWHFPLLVNPKGVALERTDPHQITQNPNNWHSAATSAGFGTPGYQNSQHSTISASSGFHITPETFSPDNDGVDDFLQIQYRFEEAGNVCNITIFDAHGRRMKRLVQNGLCGKEGFFKWDGLDDHHQPLKVGIYIIYTETFTLNGKIRQEKKAITLARRL